VKATILILRDNRFFRNLAIIEWSTTSGADVLTQDWYFFKAIPAYTGPALERIVTEYTPIWKEQVKRRPHSGKQFP